MVRRPRNARWCGGPKTFHDKPVNVLQIGLGTSKTFVRGDDTELQTLLQGTSRQQNEPLTAIGVDPVGEWIENLVQQCQASDNVALIVGAVGRTPGTRVLYGLRAKAREHVEASMRWQRMS